MRSLLCFSVNVFIWEHRGADLVVHFIIHVGGNDILLHQSEVTKVDVESVCTFAKTMLDSIVYSGPLPNLTSDDMFSRMSSLLAVKVVSSKRWVSLIIGRLSGEDLV